MFQTCCAGVPPQLTPIHYIPANSRHQTGLRQSWKTNDALLNIDELNAVKHEPFGSIRGYESCKRKRRTKTPTRTDQSRANPHFLSSVCNRRLRCLATLSAGSQMNLRAAEPALESTLQLHSSLDAITTPANSGRHAYLEFKDLRDTPRVGVLHQYMPPVTGAAFCCHVLDMLLQDKKVFAIPVIDHAGVPLALLERHSFIEYFSQRYSLELFGKKSLEQLFECTSVINRAPIVVDESTSIDDAAAMIVAAGMQHMVSGFIVTSEDKYLGIAHGHDLLNHITQRKQAELYYLAHYDQLTRIPNRMLLNDRLLMACHESDRSGAPLGLIFVDLDRFKNINDTMGHRFGDHLLQAVAERLESCIRCNDTVARLGGDEFAVLLRSLPDNNDVKITARRIVDAFRKPFSILDREVFVTASLGTTVYPRDEQDSSKLLAKADAAMYEAKQCGRNAFREYAPGLSENSQDHLSLEADLRHAIARNELVLHYQPQICIATGKAVGVEALIRWQHRTRGLLPPAAFIGIAEDSSLIVDIGNWVLREACRQQQAWTKSGIGYLRMAINISAVQFRRRNFTGTLKKIVEETGIDPGFIELELTENVAMHHAGEVLQTLKELKQIGVELSIDDFGTGFSNLSYLQHYPIDRLKIDQSFVRGIEDLPANKAIVRAIVAFAKSLELETIAEGVETEAEFAETSACACDEVQGYFHARPMPAEDLATWLGTRG